MKYIMLMSQPVRVAKLEIEGLLGTKPKVFGKICVLESDKRELFSRLAYTNEVYRFLFCCRVEQLVKSMEGFAWQKIYKENFCLRVHGSSDFSEAKLAGYIWRAVKNPRVDLENPRTKVAIFVHNKVCQVGLLFLELKHDFETRRAHLRPKMFPSSLHPKLARQMINLSGATKGAVLDPFCGTGGILIEAGLVGLKPIGYDIDDRMLAMAKQNLDFCKITCYQLKKIDATKIKSNFCYVVTDLPYGKSTAAKKGLYKSFMAVLDRYLTKRAVIGLPSTVNHKSLLRRTSLKTRSCFTYYVHKSLSRRILLLEK